MSDSERLGKEIFWRWPFDPSSVDSWRVERRRRRTTKAVIASTTSTTMRPVAAIGQ